MTVEIQTWDDRRDFIVPGNFSQTVAYSTEKLLTLAKQAIEAKGSFSIALSGGKTPKAIYALLPKHPLAKEIDWTKVSVFWSDERSVPVDHPDSNYKMAMDAGWSQLGIPSEHIFRMKTEGDIQWNAQEYEDLLRTQLSGGILDLVMLGMGSDGHTASLFPNTPGLNADERLAVANFVPQQKAWRLSLTFPCINTAKQTQIYVIGADKAEMVNTVLTGAFDPMTLPAQRVGTAEHKCLWILDEEAAWVFLENSHDD